MMLLAQTIRGLPVRGLKASRRGRGPLGLLRFLLWGGSLGWTLPFELVAALGGLAACHAAEHEPALGHLSQESNALGETTTCQTTAASRVSCPSWYNEPSSLVRAEESLCAGYWNDPPSVVPLGILSVQLFSENHFPQLDAVISQLCVQLPANML